MAVAGRTVRRRRGSRERSAARRPRRLRPRRHDRAPDGVTSVRAQHRVGITEPCQAFAEPVEMVQQGSCFRDGAGDDAGRRVRRIWSGLAEDDAGLRMERRGRRAPRPTGCINRALRQADADNPRRHRPNLATQIRRRVPPAGGVSGPTRRRSVEAGSRWLQISKCPPIPYRPGFALWSTRLPVHCRNPSACDKQCRKPSRRRVGGGSPKSGATLRTITREARASGPPKANRPLPMFRKWPIVLVGRQGLEPWTR